MNDRNTKKISKQEALELVVKVLQNYHTSEENAVEVANALVNAEIDLQVGHGLSRLPSYVDQLVSKKVNGLVSPGVISREGGVIKIDAKFGFAFPAISLAIKELKNNVEKQGISIASICHSHHSGQSSYHVEKLADAGFMSLMFCNSPKAIAPWGGYKPLFGTNPIAFAVHRHNNPSLVIDLSLSKVARGKVMRANQENKSILEGWAINSQGKPTMNAQEALDGSMLPMGDAKGSALVLMVEILVVCLSGSNFGFEASSFLDKKGSPPNVGQILIAIDTKKFNNNFDNRLEEIISAILEQKGTRLPGEKRLENRKKVGTQGINISQNLYDKILNLI